MKRILIILFILSGFAYGQTLTQHARKQDISDSLTAYTNTVKALISDSLSGTTIGDADSLGGVVATDYLQKSDSALYNTKYNHDTLATDVSTNATNILLKSNIASPTFTGTVTIPTVNVTTAFQISGTALTATMAELNYVGGVTSAIQDQIDAKSPIADPTFTGEIGIGSVNVSETELGILEGATLSTDELNYVDGVTSNIQTQINAITSGTTSALTDGYIYIGNVSGEPAEKAVSGDIGITREGVVSISSGVIVDADINSSAGITATKIGAGTVDNTELGYLNGVTGAIQTQITANANGIFGNDTDISNLQDSITAHRSDINSLDLTTVSSQVSANADSVTQLRSSINTNTGNISTNTSNIATNTSNISGLTTLANGKFYIGNGSNVATEVTAAGDVTIANDGTTAIVAGQIVNADLNASAAVDASKIADGTVSSTEFQYINSLTSNAQTQITTNVSDIDALETLESTYFYQGNGSNVATEVQITGDVVVGASGNASIQTGVIVDGMIDAAANITATKLGTGIISNTEFNYLNGVTSNIQTQIDGIIVTDTIQARGVSFDWVIPFPQSSEVYPLKRLKYNTTVDSVVCLLVTSGSGTNTITFNMDHGGNDLFASSQTADAYTTTALSITDWDVYSSFNDATIDSDDWLSVVFGTLTGTVQSITITVYGTETE